MKVTFIGGGSLRLLPILRGIFSEVPEFFRNGEVRLMDLSLERAEAVGKMILACPEYNNVNCQVIWTDDLDSSLKDIDVLYLTMAACSEPSTMQSKIVGDRYGYYASDNLSVQGAFLSLRLGRTIYDIARKLEKHSPDALMLIFPNPVAVYSHLVNTHTKIKALGICGGFNNHRYDLTRLCGKDAYDPAWNVVAAGINHLSYILRGEKNGRDLYTEILPQHLTDDWKPVKINHPSEKVRTNITNALIMLATMFRNGNKIVFSTEGDGLAHIFRDFTLQVQKQNLAGVKNFDPLASGDQWRSDIAEKFRKFIEFSKQPSKVDWSGADPLFAINKTDITIRIFQALGGYSEMRIVASRPNGNAVYGFGSEMPLEYTMDINGKNITPVANQYIPEPFYGLTASLSEFQRLQSEAIAAWSPEIFAQALEAYPVHQFEDIRKEFFCEMFDIFSDIDPVMLTAKNYFKTPARSILNFDFKAKTCGKSRQEDCHMASKTVT
jgi:alpha-galactosidase/6-phospho-beta-glucosidase family protein